MERTMKEVRSIEETIAVLRNSISLMEQNGEPAEDINDLKQSIRNYTNLRKELERSLFTKK